MNALLSEGLIELSAIPRILPGRNGKRLAPSTVWRWSNEGCRTPDGGRVKLEVVRIGGRTMTTREALQRFVERLNERPSEAPPVRTPAERRRASEAAAAELVRLGA